MKKFCSLFVVALIAMALIPMCVFAAGETVNIADSEDLIAAIKNQQPGQTWVLEAGQYDVGDGCLDVEANINGVVSGFVFPIFVDDLKIQGNGDVTITSSYDPGETYGGNWHVQNFITIGGDGVTIQDVKLKGNPNAYYGGECNKVIELHGGKDLTLNNVECLALTLEDGTKTSGSIYISSADAGNTILEDVTMSSWVSARSIETGTLTVKNLVQDFTDNAYAGFSTPEWGYAWKPGISGENVAVDGLTIKVDNNSNFVKQISDALRPGTTIELTENITVDEMLYIQTENVTIKGNGNTITASDEYVTGLHGQTNLFKIEADNVTIDNVVLKTTDKTKHVLDIYGSENVVLKDVTLDHTVATGGAPLINNASAITVEGELKLITGAASWYGVNVDDKNGEATITFAEDSALIYDNQSGNEEMPPLYLELENTTPDNVIINPENVGLELNTENGQFVIHTHTIKAVPAKDATATENGNIAYWYCEGCGKYFRDEALTEEITKEQTVIQATGNPGDNNDTGDAGMLLWSVLLVSGAALLGSTVVLRRKGEQ